MYKNKKLLTFIGSIIAASIPVAVVVSCGSAEWKYNEKENLFKGGPTLGNFQKDINEIDSSNGKTWKIVEKQAALFYYDKEQKGSLNVQRDNFLWEKKKKEDEKSNLDKDKDNNKDAIEDLKKDINNIDKKIKKIDNDDLDYSSSTFSTDYPKILLPLKQIKDKQKDIFNNQKKAFINNYPTRQEGEAAWVAELSKKYDGANTDDEAIENLVYKVIKTNAFLRNNIKINTSFTVKQLKWANTAKAKGAFPFLNIEGYDYDKKNNDIKKAIKDASKNPSLRVTGNDDTDKVYFYGSDSNIWGHKDEENLKIINKEKLQEIIGSKSIYRMYRHVLLNIKPNSKGRTLPWEASIDEIKKLISLQPTQPTSSGTPAPTYQFNRIEGLWSNMDDFTDPVDKETGFFLNQVSDNSEGTKNIGGSLGIHKTSYFSNAMFDGFALGALAIEKNDDENGKTKFVKISDDDGIYKKLSDEIKNAQDEIFGLNGNSTPFTTNEQQNQFIDSLNPDQVKNIFGKYIRNLFDPNAMKSIANNKGKIGRSLLYTDLNNNDKKNRFAFVSTKDKGGIHLIKRFVIDGDKLGQEAILELETMAVNDDIKNSQYNIAELVKPLVSEEKLINKLISDTTQGDGEKFKELITKKINDDEIKLDNLQNASITDATTLLKDAKDYIDNQNVIKANNVASEITNAHSEYLIKALDDRTIAYETYSGGETSLVNKEIIKPEDIYGIAYKLAKAEEGVI